MEESHWVVIDANPTETVATIVKEAIALMGYVPPGRSTLWANPYVCDSRGNSGVFAQPDLILYSQGEPVHNDHKRLK